MKCWMGLWISLCGCIFAANQSLGKQGDTLVLFEAIRVNDLAAAERVVRETPEILILRGTPLGVTPLMFAAYEGKERILRFFISEGALLNSRDSSGNTALKWAIQNGQFSSAALLIQRGANVKLADHRGVTPLMVSALHCSRETVDLLLAAGATKNHLSVEGVRAEDIWNQKCSGHGPFRPRKPF